MNRVMGLDGRHKDTPDHAALFSTITILLVAMVEKIGEFAYGLSVKLVVGDERAVVEEEYDGPVEACEPRDDFHIRCPSAVGALVGYE